MVTGQMYCDPKHIDCSAMEPQYVSVACPNTSEGKTPERPPLPQCRAQTVIPPQPTEKQPLLAPKKDEVSTKLNLIFKKCLWSDPPGRYCYNESKTHGALHRVAN